MDAATNVREAGSAGPIKPRGPTVSKEFGGEEACASRRRVPRTVSSWSRFDGGGGWRVGQGNCVFLIF